MANERTDRDLAEDVGEESLLSVLLLQGLLPVCGRELEHSGLRPAREKTEEVAQVSRGFDVVELAAGEERNEGGVHLAGVVTAEEQPRLPADSLSAKFAFAEVIVDGQTPVLEEALERDALIPGV